MTVAKNVLHKFEQNTKAESSKVNDNFTWVQQDLANVETALEQMISDSATNSKESLRAEIEVVKDGSAEIDLSNVESSILTNALMPDYSKPTERIIATEYIADTDLYLTITDIDAHNDAYYILDLTYKEKNIQFCAGGYSTENDTQRDFIGLNIPKGTSFKITKGGKSDIHGIIRTFPFIGTGG